MYQKLGGITFVAGIMALAVCADRQASAAPAAAPTVHDWMIGTVAPHGMELSDVVLKAINDAGKPDASAMTDADWSQIIKAAQALKESTGQVVGAPNMRVAADGVKIQDEGTPGSSTAIQIQGFIDKDRPGFNTLAGALAATSDAFITAANTKDAAKLLDASSALDSACQACHSKFWYPQQSSPPVAQ